MASLRARLTAVVVLVAAVALIAAAAITYAAQRSYQYGQVDQRVEAGEEERALLGVGDRAGDEQPARREDQQDGDQPGAQRAHQDLGRRSA